LQEEEPGEENFPLSQVEQDALPAEEKVPPGPAHKEEKTQG
jgi:hypothetical protein